jgi:hypothetical protein
MHKSVIEDHPQQEAIDTALLLDRESLKDLGQRFGISVFVLSRRKKKLMMAESDSDEPQTEIEKWLDRADIEYQKCTGDDDRRGSVAAILAALRGLEAKAREQERAVEAEPPEEDDNLTAQDIDRIVAKFSKVEAAAIDRTNQVAVTESRRMGWFDLADLFFACASDGDLRQAVLDFGQERIAAAKEKNDESVSQSHVTN